MCARLYQYPTSSNVENVNWIRTFPFSEVKALKSYASVGLLIMFADSGKHKVERNVALRYYYISIKILSTKHETHDEVKRSNFNHCQRTVRKLIHKYDRQKLSINSTHSTMPYADKL